MLRKPGKNVTCSMVLFIYNVQNKQIPGNRMETGQGLGLTTSRHRLSLWSDKGFQGDGAQP